MNNNKRKIPTIAVVVATMLILATLLLQPQQASAAKNNDIVKSGELGGIWTINPDGTKTYEPKNLHVDIHRNGKVDYSPSSSSTTTANNNDASSASKADSAAGSNAQVNQNCIGLFCLNIGSANAKSASAADSNAESRTNSPSATSNNIGKVFDPTYSNNNNDYPGLKDYYNNHGITTKTQNQPRYDVYGRLISNSNGDFTAAARSQYTSGRDCIDNTGSPNDEGYSFGYYDAQHGRSIASANEHGNHTDEWRQGYRDGWQAGAEDLTHGIDRNPC